MAITNQQQRIQIRSTNRFLRFFDLSFRQYLSPDSRVFLSAQEVCDTLDIYRGSYKACLERVLPPGSIFLGMEPANKSRHKLLIAPQALTILCLFTRTNGAVEYRRKFQSLLNFEIDPDSGDIIFTHLEKFVDSDSVQESDKQIPLITSEK